MDAMNSARLEKIAKMQSNRLAMIARAEKERAVDAEKTANLFRESTAAVVLANRALGQLQIGNNELAQYGLAKQTL